MQIIIPMAGLGERFMRAGYQTIKPLISVDDVPIIEYVMKLFPGNHRVIFICNEQHLASTELARVLKRLVPMSSILSIAPHKYGPIYSILQQEQAIDDVEETLVNYCDFNVRWDFQKFMNLLATQSPDGVVSCYTGFHPHLLGPNMYAGVRTDDNLRLLEIREKYSFTEDKMQSHHSVGTYYFKTGAQLKHYAHQLIEFEGTTRGEYYVSSLFQLMKNDGLDLRVFTVDKFCQWGTPEDFAEYMAWHRYFKNDGLVPPTDDPRVLSYWHDYFHSSYAQ